MICLVSGDCRTSVIDSRATRCAPTLIKTMAELVVGSDEVNGCLRIGVVGCDGVDQGIQGLFHSVELRLQDVVHGCEARRLVQTSLYKGSGS